MDCWQCLQIEPTHDTKLIKRAYAKLIKQYTPESDPNAFQTIREAFEDAKKQAAYIQIDTGSDGVKSFGGEALTESTTMSDGAELKHSEASGVDRGFLDKELLDKELVDKELVDKELVDKELVDKELLDKELLDKELLDKELLEKDLVEKALPEIEHPDLRSASLSDSAYERSSINTLDNQESSKSRDGNENRENSEQSIVDNHSPEELAHETPLAQTESESAALDHAISDFQAEFWLRFEALINNTEIKLEQWHSLLNSDVMLNIEVKQLLHYQVFESLVEIISHAEKNTKLALNQQVIKLLTDTFGWRDNELALANTYGYDGVSLVMDFDSPIGTNRQRVIDEINAEPGFFKKTIFPALSWIVLLGILYFAIHMMNSKRKNVTQNNINEQSSQTSFNGTAKEEVSQAYIIKNCRRLFDIQASLVETEVLFNLCQSFAEQHQDEYAALYIGSAKMLSSTLPLEPELALSWLKASSDQGNEQASFWLGVLLSESGNRFKDEEDGELVLSSAYYMGSRYARPYLYGMNLSKQVNESHLDAFHLAVNSIRSELGHISTIAQIYYRFLLTHKQTSIPQYDLNDQGVQEILEEFTSIISGGTALEKARLLHLILSYTRPYEYDAELKQIAESFVSDTHNYPDVETYIWVAAFKAYSMDFGAANAIIDIAKIKLSQSQAYFAPDYKQYLMDTMSKQQAAYHLMETVHIPLGDANMRQLAREVMTRTKQLAIKQLVEG
jgi:curved DNA-binding protein CbpA